MNTKSYLIKTLAIISVGILLIITNGSTYARWVTKADAGTKSSYYYARWDINNDGSYENTEETNIEILTQTGREKWANFRLYYNDDNQKLQILDAKTIYKRKEYKLDNSLMEDKPLASSRNGFDQIRQIMLAFPNVQIHSKIHLKCKLTQNKPTVENFFSQTFYFGNKELEEKSTVEINSKLPLYIVVNDPEKSLKITKTKTDDHYKIVITLIKPIYKDISNEEGPIIVENKYLTWVAVSSLNKWEDLAIKFEKLFAKIYTQKLPKTFNQILNIAKKQKNEINQINTVTAMLNDKIRYLGDWRSINGRLVPHDLEIIEQNQLGDCKDFAASTAAILTKLGFKAQIALVARGIVVLTNNALPGFEFNHAIVKVTNKNGKTYWIDPTNFESMAGGIFPDIANKMALILDDKQPSYEKIPAIDPNENGYFLKRELKILDDNKIIEGGSLKLKLQNTLGITGYILRNSYEDIKNSVFYVLADYVDLDEKNKEFIKLPKLNSRMVKDITIDYGFKRENEVLKTNAGPALKLKYPYILGKIYRISQNYVSMSLIDDFPTTFERQTIIKNISADNIDSLNQELKNQWLYIKRTCKFNQNNDLQIDDAIILYKNLIPSEDFKKPEFIKMKNWLKNNFKDTVIVFKHNNSSNNPYNHPS